MRTVAPPIPVCLPPPIACLPIDHRYDTGMHTNAVDARRAMSLVEQADGADGGGPDGDAAVGRRGGAEGSSATAREREASKGGMGGGMGGRPDDAAALVRRAKALGVPPLPPDLGAVRYVPCRYRRTLCVRGRERSRVFLVCEIIDHVIDHAMSCFEADEPA